MTDQLLSIIQPKPGTYNIDNYRQVVKDFSWKQAAPELSFHQSGKLNAAYETIDRHVADGYGDKVALYYVNEEDDEKRSYTFREVKQKKQIIMRVSLRNMTFKRVIVFLFFYRRIQNVILQF